MDPAPFCRRPRGRHPGQHQPAYRAHELEDVLRRSRIKPLFLWKAGDRCSYREIFEHAIHGKDLALDRAVWIGSESLQRFLDAGRDVPSFAASPEDVANIQYTSGTTGSPKGVLLTHRNVVNNGLFMPAGKTRAAPLARPTMLPITQPKQ